MGPRAVLLAALACAASLTGAATPGEGRRLSGAALRPVTSKASTTSSSGGGSSGGSSSRGEDGEVIETDGIRITLHD